MVLDVEALVSRYQGEAKIHRLLYMALHPPGDENATAWTDRCYRLLAIYLKENDNVIRYKHVFGHMQSSSASTSAERATGSTSASPLRRTPASGSATSQTATGASSTLPPPNRVEPYDTRWVQEATQRVRAARDTLASRLASAQSQLHKEAIRVAYLALASYETQVGNISDAFHHALRAKEYCVSRQQTTQVSLKVLETALALDNYAAVQDFATKLEHTLGNNSRESNVGNCSIRIAIALGLERLAAQDFSAAASHFASVVLSPSQPTAEPWTTVLAADEAAGYAGLLALACSSPNAMAALAEDGEVLELAPALRQALLLWTRKYAYRECYELLMRDVFPKMAVDVYLGPILPRLQTLIREKIIAQYWEPYQRMALSTMAETLGPDLVPSDTVLLDQMVQLITSGRVRDTRIDMQQRVLVRETVEEETSRLERTQAQLERTTRTVLDDTLIMVVRLACVEHNLSVKDAESANEPRRKGHSRRTQPAMEDVTLSSDDEVGEVYADMVAEDDVPMEDMDQANPEDLY
ncbi:COP9 SigNalosome subunit 1 [Phaeodactylum tricornutum CCAP 1055/1]|uniref:COP9 SigNalosome subunit 1 n=1 Tax=Phaeodactylum tricornutum (strain CCAP 1055/1) TaxID=556484 RepID=B7G4D4_PHATC|nr:COP9 SigNalosome subunit 1 [Phaeodactylum tricornutum CCAP 1055/1]EEC46433.1 COP9 SigNalosome subunit 1 [Phaeodactylum tricornutum CCAP 1055/1]|eukprot:XP_002181893.1 COP9 SigNalosome subunit 1 [Phaeodactylum tricornutum CCAP 1055/1]